MSAVENRRIVLAQRPQGAPASGDFRLERLPLPVPRAGEVLLRTLYLSLDPYMRGRMNAARSYAEPVALGEVMTGGAVCRVETSQLDGYVPGDLVVTAQSGWQDYALDDGRDLRRITAAASHPTQALGVLGMPGFTAWYGLLQIGQPKAGETVVVAAATGAVGSVVGQIARLRGCHVVGIAGGRDKCRFAVEQLGFDACLDHHEEALAERLASATPQGIDIYFENVGGEVLQAVLPRLNDGVRIPLCGLIAYANASQLPAGPDLSPVLLRTLLIRRARMQGFIIFDHEASHRADFEFEMSAWLRSGAVTAQEDVIEGLENAPAAFMGLLRGDNFGKLVVKVAA